MDKDNLITRILQYSVGVLATVLVLEIVYAEFAVGDFSNAESAVEQLLSDTSPALTDMGSENDFQEAVDRSLFSWNRQPVAAEQTAQVNQTGEIESRWELSGIVISPSDSYALFSATEGDQRLRIARGMYFEKWKVESITREQVTLADGEKQTIFRLKESVNEKPTGKNRGRKSGRDLNRKRLSGRVKSAEQQKNADNKERDEETSE